MAKISIIVPVYNTSQYLEKSLSSICSQSLNDIEIICVNDGSTDNSAEILDKFQKQDPRIKIISQKNMGLGAARNSGLQASTGEFVGFIDSDDTIDVDFYQKLYQASSESGADIVYTPFNYIFPDKTFKEIIKEGEYTRLKDKFNILNNGGVTNKLFKKDLLKNLRFPTGLIYEDNLFLIKAVTNSKKVKVINNCYYHYFIKENSLTTDKNNKQKRDEDALVIAKEIIAFAAPLHLSNEEKLELIDFTIRSFIYTNRLQNPQFVKSLRKIVSQDSDSLKILNKILQYNKLTFLDKIFSVKKYRNLRVIRFLGLKLKIKRK